MMQYREKTAIRALISRLGVPSQTRVLDSRSYFFITASTSAAVPVEVSWTSTTGVTGS